MAKKRDYYEILGVAKDADDAALKSAYRKLAMRYHPDRNPGDKVAEEKFKEAAEAYSVLSDGQKPAAYDRFGFTGNQHTYQTEPQPKAKPKPEPQKPKPRPRGTRSDGYQHLNEEEFSDILGKAEQGSLLEQDAFESVVSHLRDSGFEPPYSTYKTYLKRMGHEEPEGQTEYDSRGQTSQKGRVTYDSFNEYLEQYEQGNLLQQQTFEDIVSDLTHRGYQLPYKKYKTYLNYRGYEAYGVRSGGQTQYAEQGPISSDFDSNLVWKSMRGAFNGAATTVVGTLSALFGVAAYNVEDTWWKVGLGVIAWKAGSSAIKRFETGWHESKIMTTAGAVSVAAAEAAAVAFAYEFMK